MGTGGHYITMLPADWSIFTTHDPLTSSCHSKWCYRIHLYWGSTVQPSGMLCKDPFFQQKKEEKDWTKLIIMWVDLRKGPTCRRGWIFVFNRK